MNNIIDIRPFKEYHLGHIPNAKNIESTQLINNPEIYLNKNETYYLYCKSGIRSKKVVYVLNNMGYNTVNIPGGYDNYLLRK